MGGDWENAHSLPNKHPSRDGIDLGPERQNVKGAIVGAINCYLDRDPPPMSK